MASCTPFQAMQCRSLFDRFRNGPSMSRDGLVRVLDVIGYHAEEERYEELFAKFDSSFGETLQYDDFLEIMNFLHDKVEGMRAWLNSLIDFLQQMGTETYGRADMQEALATECRKAKKNWNIHEMMHWIPEQTAFTIDELRQISENVRVFAEDPPRERCVPYRTFYFSITILQAFHLELFVSWEERWGGEGGGEREREGDTERHRENKLHISSDTITPHRPDQNLQDGASSTLRSTRWSR